MERKGRDGDHSAAAGSEAVPCSFQRGVSGS